MLSVQDKFLKYTVPAGLVVMGVDGAPAVMLLQPRALHAVTLNWYLV